MKNITSKKGASPRKLDERELHRELRRADAIISNALEFIPTNHLVAFETSLIDDGLTTADDLTAYASRNRALNRITPYRDYSKILLVMLCLLLGWAWYTAQLDRDLFMQQIQQGEQQYGDSN